MTTTGNQSAERTLVFVRSASPLDAANTHLLTALQKHCFSTIMAEGSPAVEPGVVSAHGKTPVLHFDSTRGLVGVLTALNSTGLQEREAMGRQVLIVSADLVGPLSDLDTLFTTLDALDSPIRLLFRPDPEFSGEQGTETLGLSPLFTQLDIATLKSSQFTSALEESASDEDLIRRLETKGIPASWIYDSADSDYILRSGTPVSPLIPWAIFTSDPLLLERWAVSGRNAYKVVKESGYPLDIFWDHLTHAVPPQTWYTNLALLDIPRSGANRPSDNSLRTAVCAHIFYPDMLPEMLHYASHVPSPVSLFVTTDNADKKADLERQLHTSPDAGHFDSIEVRLVSTNDGRDISALLVDCADVISNPEFDLVIKMHSKRSVQDPQSVSSWFRRHLFENLFSTKSHVDHIYRRFAEEPQLGIVFPPVIHMGLPTMGNGWTANRLPAEALRKRLGINIPFDTHTPLSPYGSMFIARRETLLPLVEAAFTPEEFPSGGNYRDGSLAHVLERLYSYVVFSQGYFARCVQTAELAEISAVTLEYKLDSTSSYLHPHVLEQVKMLDSTNSSAPSAASIRSLVQRRVSERFPKLGATLTSTWMAGKTVTGSVRRQAASLKSRNPH